MIYSYEKIFEIYALNKKLQTFKKYIKILTVHYILTIFTYNKTYIMYIKHMSVNQVLIPMQRYQGKLCVQWETIYKANGY